MLQPLGHQGLFHCDMKWQLHRHLENAPRTRSILGYHESFGSCLESHLLNLVQALKFLCIQNNLLGKLFCEIFFYEIAVVVLHLQHSLLMQQVNESSHSQEKPLLHHKIWKMARNCQFVIKLNKKHSTRKDTCHQLLLITCASGRPWFQKNHNVRGPSIGSFHSPLWLLHKIHIYKQIPKESTNKQKNNPHGVHIVICTCPDLVKLYDQSMLNASP